MEMVTQLQSKMTQACTIETEKKIILTDRYVLNDEYDPDTILHREKETTEIMEVVKDIWNQGGHKHLNISGSPGTGKTMLCRYVANELNKRASAENKKIKAIYINCKDIKTQTALMRKIAIELTGTTKVGLGLSANTETISKALQNHNSILLILDEIHKLVENPKETPILYNLSDEDKFTLIFISNKIRWFTDCVKDEAIKSRLRGMTTLIFNPYNHQHMFDILQYRAEKALAPNTYTDKILNQISKKVSQRSGDMRDALRILKESAIVAQNTGRIEIDSECVEISDVKTKNDGVLERIHGTTPSKRLILIIIYEYQQKNGEAPTVEQITRQYNKYTQRTEFLEPLKTDAIRNYLKELEAMGFITHITGKALGHGRGREPNKFVSSLNIDPDQFSIFYQEFFKPR